MGSVSVSVCVYVRVRVCLCLCERVCRQLIIYMTCMVQASLARGGKCQL